MNPRQIQVGPNKAASSNQDADAAQQMDAAHLEQIYRIRRWTLVLSGFMIAIGALMIVEGLEGNINVALNTSNTLGAQLTNASPGIVFAFLGFLLALVGIVLKPVTRTKKPSTIGVDFSSSFSSKI